MSEEGAALTTLLSDDERHHKSFVEARTRRRRTPWMGYQRAAAVPTTLLNVRTPPGRSLAAQCLVNALHQDVPLSTNARLAWLHAAIPLCIRTDEMSGPRPARRATPSGVLVSDASCSIKASPLPRWWDADDAGKGLEEPGGPLRRAPVRAAVRHTKGP